MTQIKFESLLGKNINETLSMGFIKNEIDDKIYTAPKQSMQFFGKPISQIAAITNNEQFIQSIIISFTESEYHTLFNLINDNYGDDHKIMIGDKIISQKSTTNETEGGFKETLKTTTMTLKVGGIEDSDIKQILWDKECFQIRLYIKKNHKIDLHFVKK